MQVCKISPWHKNGAMILTPLFPVLLAIIFLLTVYWYYMQKSRHMTQNWRLIPQKYLPGWCQCRYFILIITHCSPIARVMGPTWSPPIADRTQVGPTWATWTLLSGLCRQTISSSLYSILMDDNGWTCGYQICIRRATLNYSWNFKSRSSFFIEREGVKRWVAVYTMTCGHIHQLWQE